MELENSGEKHLHLTIFNCIIYECSAYESDG